MEKQMENGMEATALLRVSEYWGIWEQNDSR